MTLANICHASNIIHDLVKATHIATTTRSPATSEKQRVSCPHGGG